MDALDLRGGADAAWELVSAANLFIQQRAPWTLAKAGDDAALDAVLAALAACLARLSVMIHPFLPTASSQLWETLGFSTPVTAARLDALPALAVAGQTTRRPAVMFPKGAES
jgi:methionyl-tRNA synthetase